jgi:hypothetical protein
MGDGSADVQSQNLRSIANRLFDFEIRALSRGCGVTSNLVTAVIRKVLFN